MRGAAVASEIYSYWAWRKEVEAEELARKNAPPPKHDWEVDPRDIAIKLRPDGREWELGHGSFGRVLLGVRNEVQVRAADRQSWQGTRQTYERLHGV